MKIRNSFDIVQMQQFLSVYKSLIYLDLDLGFATGHLRLPDSVTHLTVGGIHLISYEKVVNVNVSSRYLKPFIYISAEFRPDAFAFPELEYLCVWDGRICHTSGHGQRHFSKLKRLECADIKVGDDLALLEIAHPSESIVLDVWQGYEVDRQTKYAWFRHLLFFANLPPLVVFHVACMELLPDDLYFFQRLLARQSNSQVQIINCSLTGYPPGLKEISAKYRTLLSSNVTYSYICDAGDIEARITDTYALTRDFVNAPLDNVDEKLRLLLTTSPNAS
ncbi:hypothetical protein TRVA0_076S00386 [Trichomonascus vanleenenianus]|uniref:uncharacterized protein n=1 Tax=Trichomonascus vanleenenianus TaxID=2268995 RepID=UPI003ECB525B